MPSHMTEELFYKYHWLSDVGKKAMEFKEEDYAALGDFQKTLTKELAWLYESNLSADLAYIPLFVMA